MLSDYTYNELLSIKASAMVLAERAERLILKEEKLRGGSPSRSKKTGLSEADKAKLIAKKRTTQLRKR